MGVMMILILIAFVCATIVCIFDREWKWACICFLATFVLSMWMGISLMNNHPDIVYVRIQTAKEGQGKLQYIELGSVVEPKRESVTKVFGALYPENSIVEVKHYKDWSCGIRWGSFNVMNKIITPDDGAFTLIEKSIAK